MNMDHMKYLQIIANDDVRILEHKEATYKASWKKRGGVGAAMMVLRKIDRLENMLEERSWDIFKNIGDGSDGTMIAEIRDLRRYLLLIEAEMVARETDKFDAGPDECDTGVALTKAINSVLAEDGPGTPEDGGHHARVRMEDGLSDKDIEPEYLTDYMLPPGEGTLWIVDRNHVHVDRWDHLPRLRIELNHREYQDIPVYYQSLYIWHELQTKFILAPRYQEHWGKQ